MANQAKRIFKTRWTLTQKNMEYDGMDRGMVNQGGKHWWYIMMKSMSKPKKDKIIMSKASAPRKLMIACVRCMMSSGDMLNLFLLRINDHNWNKEHTDAANGMDGPLV
jgi:hypothetical protein